MVDKPNATVNLDKPVVDKPTIETLNSDKPVVDKPTIETPEPSKEPEPSILADIPEPPKPGDKVKTEKPKITPCKDCPYKPNECFILGPCKHRKD